jgi:ribosome-binding protein aMBF1 (putative translation factor)
MATTKAKRIEPERDAPPTLVLGGVRYVVLTESAYRVLRASAGEDSVPWDAWAEDAENLAAALAERRRAVGLSQADLAEAAGVRVETVNRIERGHNVPDFATVRKLLKALRTATKEKRS